MYNNLFSIIVLINYVQTYFFVNYTSKHVKIKLKSNFLLHFNLRSLTKITVNKQFI